MKVTERGYRRGVEPANKGCTYPPEPLTAGEVLALMEACPARAPFGVRDRAVIALLWRSGLRISEALALRAQDLNREACTVTVRCGKGGKYRVSGMDPFGWEQLDRWLEMRAGYPAGPVFCIVEGATKGVRPMGAPYFRKALKRLAVEAGVVKRVHPHGFRHSHACDLAGEGVLLHLVSRQLGHSNLGTTATYLAGIAPVEVVNAVAARPAPVRNASEQKHRQEKP